MTKFYHDRGYRSAGGHGKYGPSAAVRSSDRPRRSPPQHRARPCREDTGRPEAPLLELDGQPPTIVAAAAWNRLPCSARPTDQVTDDADARTKAAVETVGTEAVNGPDRQTGIVISFVQPRRH